MFKVTYINKENGVKEEKVCSTKEVAERMAYVMKHFAHYRRAVKAVKVETC